MPKIYLANYIISTKPVGEDQEPVRIEKQAFIQAEDEHEMQKKIVSYVDESQFTFERVLAFSEKGGDLIV